MSGNVWEWTRSLHGDYPYPGDAEGRRDREDLKASGRRVLRGGAFFNYHSYLRCAFRGHHEPGYRNDDGGFQVVLSPFL
jgi:formylglycine-generating enzyme required for sulfatase activity